MSSQHHRQPNQRCVRDTCFLSCLLQKCHPAQPYLVPLRHTLSRLETSRRRTSAIEVPSPCIGDMCPVRKAENSPMNRKAPGRKLPPHHMNDLLLHSVAYSYCKLQLILQPDLHATGRNKRNTRNGTLINRWRTGCALFHQQTALCCKYTFRLLATLRSLMLTIMALRHRTGCPIAPVRWLATSGFTSATAKALQAHQAIGCIMRGGNACMRLAKSPPPSAAQNCRVNHLSAECSCFLLH